jgi:arabinose-5-phosphate isomerase
MTREGPCKSSSRLVEIGRRVLMSESAALTELARQLDDNFSRVVDLVYECKGHVIITGIGKSGHVGRKIAATMASTGTPAFFVHAAEAVHGDLGMITADDVVIAISNSGETEDVVRLVSPIRLIGAKIIAMTGNVDSSLAKQSDALLPCFVAGEADPLNLAPTNSTAAALGLGDALAVALMTIRGFGEDDFARYHPGGSLGKRLQVQKICGSMQREG